MRTVLTQEQIAMIIADFVNKKDGECGPILLSHFDSGEVGAVVDHRYEFELPTDEATPDE